MDLHGFVRVVLPDGWTAEPAELPFGLPPGGHLTSELTVTAPAGRGAGPVSRAGAAELAGDVPASWRQVVEDVAVRDAWVRPEPTNLIRLSADP